MKAKFVKETLNEASENSLRNAVNKIISKKDYPHKQMLWDRREDLYYSLKRAGYDDTTTLTQIVKDKEKFEKLSHEDKEDIMAVSGIGKSPNKKLLAKLIKAFEHFHPSDIGRDIEEKVDAAINFKRKLEKGNYPTSLTGIDGEYKIALRDDLPSPYKIPEILTEEELQALQSIVKPKYERVVEKFLSDDAINDYISYMVLETSNSKEVTDKYQFAGVNYSKDFPEFFNYVKDQLLEGGGLSIKDFQNMKVKFGKIHSDTSDVVSSSFTTFYYYDMDVEFDGKKFHADRVRVGSSHYSGGWN